MNKLITLKYTIWRIIWLNKDSGRNYVTSETPSLHLKEGECHIQNVAIKSADFIFFHFLSLKSRLSLKRSRLNSRRSTNSSSWGFIFLSNLGVGLIFRFIFLEFISGELLSSLQAPYLFHGKMMFSMMLLFVGLCDWPIPKLIVNRQKKALDHFPLRKSITCYYIINKMPG